MSTPIFECTSYHNSFRVFIPNLESLSVAQIQEIELFVQNRKGIFDFNTYIFSIQKKIDLFEFEKLLKESSIVANCIDKPLVLESSGRMQFGKYKGVNYSDIPDSYLLWLKTNYMGKDKENIYKELTKRKL
ncbi:hypothetical protein GJV85_06740 [Sulfurimonas aquatica]|uniref:Uncharacterized protein n=1 Tax=Sulfurimonas aquatica TaxID=2672570 RepID=A0A975B0C7_9BACT|nr:DUF3820 family protein [Sulfurimonas aquatica]QSZ41815.1 hypothetical protein GJV85_06740 [Sulfurimonas aquatica]